MKLSPYASDCITKAPSTAPGIVRCRLRTSGADDGRGDDVQLIADADVERRAIQAGGGNGRGQRA